MRDSERGKEREKWIERDSESRRKRERERERERGGGGVSRQLANHSSRKAFPCLLKLTR